MKSRMVQCLCRQFHCEPCLNRSSTMSLKVLRERLRRLVHTFIEAPLRRLRRPRSRRHVLSTPPIPHPRFLPLLHRYIQTYLYLKPPCDHSTLPCVPGEDSTPSSYLYFRYGRHIFATLCSYGREKMGPAWEDLFTGQSRWQRSLP